ncbi:MAG: hypothetical protein N4A44_04030 [Alphaproteobacteria bacterium]|nr:hypothetical protein [Alphaproteobacteria bacterium]
MEHLSDGAFLFMTFIGVIITIKFSSIVFDISWEEISATTWKDLVGMISHKIKK